MLDFKIKELKREIAPREAEIHRLFAETNKMDEQLKHYNKLNANFGFIVDDLRVRQNHLQDLNKKYRIQVRNNEIYIRQFKNRVYWVVQNIDDHDSLKRSVNQNLYEYVKTQTEKNVQVDAEIKKECESQKLYLENSVHSLKKRKEKNSALHKEDNLNIMHENQSLIQDIMNLRKDLIAYEKEFSDLGSNKTLNQVKAKQKAQEALMQDLANQAQGGQMGGSQASMISGGMDGTYNMQMQKDLQVKRKYIEDLRERLNLLQQENMMIKQNQSGYGGGFSTGRLQNHDNQIVDGTMWVDLSRSFANIHTHLH